MLVHPDTNGDFSRTSNIFLRRGTAGAEAFKRVIVFAPSPACETRPLCEVALEAEKYPSAIAVAKGYFFLSQFLFSRYLVVPRTQSDASSTMRVSGLSLPSNLFTSIRVACSPKLYTGCATVVKPGGTSSPS